MSKPIKYIAYIIAAYFVVYFLYKLAMKSKYIKFLHELGFFIADKMTSDEIKTSYIYLHDYARLYTSQASQILRAENPTLWNKAKAISEKYKIFNL